MDEEFMELDNKFFYKKSITGIEIDKFLTETDYISEINEETSPYNGKTAENIIYYGAPGTGKSYGVSEYVNDHICENQKSMMRAGMTAGMSSERRFIPNTLTRILSGR